MKKPKITINESAAHITWILLNDGQMVNQLDAMDYETMKEQVAQHYKENHPDGALGLQDAWLERHPGDTYYKPPAN